MSRKQCKKCPWKTSTDPREIPNGYCEVKHANLSKTIAKPGELRFNGAIHIMACHETGGETLLPCVGWLVNQLGPGNNLTLRLRVFAGDIDADVKPVGPQHETLEATLPRRRR